MPQLTVAALKALPFRLSLHLNRGKEHDRVASNDEFNLHVSTTSRKPRFEIVRKVLYSPNVPVEVDFLAGDVDAQFARFCAEYNRVNAP